MKGLVEFINEAQKQKLGDIFDFSKVDKRNISTTGECVNFFDEKDFDFEKVKDNRAAMLDSSLAHKGRGFVSREDLFKYSKKNPFNGTLQDHCTEDSDVLTQCGYSKYPELMKSFFEAILNADYFPENDKKNENALKKVFKEFVNKEIVYKSFHINKETKEEYLEEDFAEKVRFKLNFIEPKNPDEESQIVFVFEVKVNGRPQNFMYEILLKRK